MHHKHKKSYWVLPGGGVNPMESMETAVVREIKEELGIEIKIHNLAFVDEFIDQASKRHVVKIGFITTLPDNVSKNIKVVAENEAIKMVRFFSEKEISRSLDQFYPSKEFYLNLLQL